jgi:small GTP-binding protein
VDGLALQTEVRLTPGVSRDIAFSPCGRYLAVANDTDEIAVWAVEDLERASRRPTFTLREPKSTVLALAWSPDGQTLLSGSAEGHLLLWSIPEATLRSRVAAPSDATGERPDIFAVAWHPEGDVFASGGGDATVTIWDVPSGERIRGITNPISGQYVTSVAWSPDGHLLAAATQMSGCIRVWDRAGLEEHWSHDGVKYVHRLDWSPSGQLLVAGYASGMALVFDRDGQLRRTLEGYTESVKSVAFTPDGRTLVTGDEAPQLRLWSTENWVTFPPRPVEALIGGWVGNFVAVHPQRPVLALLEKRRLSLWSVNSDALEGGATTHLTVRSSSAKVVLTGESNVGKSCLAMRLSEDRFPTDDELGTTHGMTFWPMDVDRLTDDPLPPGIERRDVVLWDFGGQHEYRLVHQLFLGDTTVALVLFDPTRGSASIDEVREWNRHLERHLNGDRAVKLLIGAKQDIASPLVDRAAIDEVVAECGFERYVEVSAKTGRNLDELRAALGDALDWESLAATSRPALFQRVRDHIETHREQGDVVMLVADVQRELEQQYPDLYDANEVVAAAAQLALQGVIARTALSDGADALVLQVPAIERYAGALLVAARSNPRRVPALEERLLGSPDLPLPGIDAGDRLPRLDERVVVECVAELMIEHGLCFRHENLLIFPSLFPAPPEAEERLPHSISLYYDFTGAIDNIYASLVARLVMSAEFGSGRLYPGRVEFDAPGKGVCGVRQIARRGGLAHLDLFFSDTAGPERRDLFSHFVADHLRSHGVVIREHETIRCSGCGRQIAEDIVQANVAAGERDVICPYCRALTLIGEAVGTDLTTSQRAAGRIYALRKAVETRLRRDTSRAKASVAESVDAHDDAPIRLLHLSDLHFTSRTSPEAKARWLLQDVRAGAELGFPTVEYLVISGDMTDRGGDVGFEQARRFVTIVNEELGISAERCLFVPGNHDVQDRETTYDWCASQDKARAIDPDESRWHREGQVILVPNPARYGERLSGFSDAFFHKVIQRPYPLEPGDQGIAYLFSEWGIQFLTLNSSWEIDQFHRKRASVHPDAVARVIQAADRQVDEAVEAERLHADPLILRIGVWHHALQHPEMVSNTEFVGILRQAGVRIALHGDVHELNREKVAYWERDALHVIGGGSFGSPAEGRPESTPRLYNVLEIDRGLRRVRVHTRHQQTPDGVWSGWNVWPRPDGGPGGLPFYDLELQMP